jgi:hypothetical protein
MPAAKTAEWMVLLLYPPGKTPERVGIVLLDSSDRVMTKLKPKLDHEDEAILTVWDGLVEELQDEAEGNQIVRWLEMNGSHVFQLSRRKPVESKNLTETLNDLYRENVG